MEDTLASKQEPFFLEVGSIRIQWMDIDSEIRLKLAKQLVDTFSVKNRVRQIDVKELKDWIMEGTKGIH